MGGQPGCQPRAFLFINKTSRGQKLTFDFNHGFKSIISGTRWLSSSSLVPGGWGWARGGQTVMSGCRGREVSAKGGAGKTHFCWRIGSLLVTAPCSSSVLVLDVISDEDNDVTTTGYLSKYLASAWLCKWQNPIHHQPLHWNYWMEVLYLVITTHHLYLSAYLWDDTLNLNNLLAYICLMPSKTVC